MTDGAPSSGAFDPGSFRDPASRVLHRNGAVYRVLAKRGLDDWRAVQASPAFDRWMGARTVVGTVEETLDGEQVLRHDPIPFWSYPYEWPFSMLRDAARLHLELLEQALEAGLTMKDATPYNVQFRGCRPVFVDVGSFAPYERGEPWLGYRQFCRLFLYPLLIRAHADVPFQPMLRGNLDGISAATARQLLRGRRTLASGVMADVVLQNRAERTAGTRDVRSELSEAGFDAPLILGNVRRLQKVVDKTTWTPSTSTWSDYASCGHVATQRSPKEAFVRNVAGKRHRRLVWDLGANDGHFSIAVAPHADTVVAVDGDEETIEGLYRRLSGGGPSNVLPLVMNLADPSPGLGWRGLERRPLEQRSTPDLVLLLAVIHHMVIGSNLPLGAVIAWLRSFDAEIVFEWVPIDDPMSQQLTANKRATEVHADYTEGDLRAYLAEAFTVVDETPLEGRRLFHLAPA